jgi:hypothetical protein
MKIMKQFETMSISNFVHITKGGVIYKDPSIQRRLCWDNDNKEGYLKSLKLNLHSDNFVICDIESCMDRAKFDGNTEDYKYFKNLYDLGYRYISIDGANRTEFLLELYHKYYNGESPVPEDISNIFYSEIQICKYKQTTKEELHFIFLYKNSHKSPNDQEKRNSILGPVSTFVRSMGDTYQGSLGVIPKVNNFPRMKDLEHITSLLMYHQNPLIKPTPSNLKKLYEKPELDNQKEFTSIIKIWGMCITLMYVTNSKLSSSTSFNLFMFILDMNRKYRCVLNKELLPQFIEKYLELDNLRRANTVLNEPKTNWSLLNRTMGANLGYKFECIYEDFKPHINDYFYELDSKRLFTELEKIIKHIENGFMVKMGNGSYEVVTILQMLNGEFYHGGHKDKPFTKGGKGIMDNLEIQSAFDNMSQSNRH